MGVWRNMGKRYPIEGRWSCETNSGQLQMLSSMLVAMMIS